MKSRQSIVATVHTIQDYKHLIVGGNEKLAASTPCLLFRTTMDNALHDDSSHLTAHLRALPEKDKIRLIAALIQNDQTWICETLSPLLSQTVDDISMLPYIAMHSEHDEDDQWLNHTCLALISRVLEQANGCTLPVDHSQRIISKAMASIPDTFIDLPSKLAIHKRIISPPEYLHLSYQETLSSLEKNTSSGRVDLDEYIATTQFVCLDISEYLFLTLGLLQTRLQDQEGVKELLLRCRELYMETEYEMAVIVINEMADLYKYDIGSQACQAIAHAQQNVIDVSIHQNYSRRFFENRIVALYKGQCIDKAAIDAINRIARHFLGIGMNPAIHSEDAIAMILEIDELDDEAIIKKEFEFKEQAVDWNKNGRTRRPGILSEYHVAKGQKSQLIFTRNLGVMCSSQPNYLDELSKHTLQNVGADVYSLSTNPSESEHPRSAYVASISGHAFAVAGLLILYLEKNPSLATNTNDINHFIKIFACTYASYGFHSIQEVMTIFNQPHVKAAFEKQGITLDIDWPNIILEQAFQDTQEYTKQLCLRQSLCHQLKLPLISAVMSGHFNVIDMLLNRGFNPNPMSDKLNPLYIAIRKGYLKIANKLINAGANPTLSLFIAIQERDLSSVYTLLKYTIDLSYTYDQLNLLDYAIQSDDIGIIEAIHEYLTQRQYACEKKISRIKPDRLNKDRELAIKYLRKFDVSVRNPESIIKLETLLDNFYILDKLPLPLTQNEANKLVNGRPLLLIAVESNRIDIVEALLENGVNPDTAPQHGDTPLLMATDQKQTLIVKLLLAYHANPNVSHCEFYPLHLAVINKDHGLIRALIEAGATLDIELHNGATPLFIAVKQGYLETAKLLIEVGANLKKTLVSGQTLLSLAVQQGQLDVIRLLLEKCAPADVDVTDLLIAAVEKNAPDIVKVLLQAGAQVDALDHENQPILCIAAKNGYINVVTLLLKAGANPDVTDEDDTTPLRLAIVNGHLDIVMALIENEAKLFLPDASRLSLIELAVQSNHMNIAHLINAFMDDKMAACQKEIDDLKNHTHNKARQIAIHSLEQFQEGIASTPEMALFLELRILHFDMLDALCEKANRLLTDHKIKPNKVDAVTSGIRQAYLDLSEGKEIATLLSGLTQLINESKRKKKCGLFDDRVIEADLETLEVSKTCTVIGLG